MKSNRQIGLDGKIFVSSCLQRGAFFVFLLMLGGLVNAMADIWKLSGASGAQMSSFTVTLLLYDFISSLLLVAVMFYAYFLECGTSVPKLKQKPLVWFGFFRLGYYLLLGYYICYRALYCITHTSSVPASFFVFYLVYFIWIFILIMANCYVFNILTRNTIRRNYEKDFRVISAAGVVVQMLLPICYVIARATIKEVGDEYFTASFCDFVRLFICPVFTTGVWFLFVHAVEQVKEVFAEVDCALRERRYQIAYTGSSAYGSKQNSSFAPVLPAPAMAAAGGSALPPHEGEKSALRSARASKRKDKKDALLEQAVSAMEPGMDAAQEDAPPAQPEKLESTPEPSPKPEKLEAAAELTAEPEKQGDIVQAEQDIERQDEEKPETGPNELPPAEPRQQEKKRVHPVDKLASQPTKQKGDSHITGAQQNTAESASRRLAAQQRATEQAESAAKQRGHTAPASDSLPPQAVARQQSTQRSTNRKPKGKKNKL